MAVEVSPKREAARVGLAEMRAVIIRPGDSVEVAVLVNGQERARLGPSSVARAREGKNCLASVRLIVSENSAVSDFAPVPTVREN